jgi:hypothetical protein
MITRLIFVLAGTFLLSGCCEVFGICTSVSVHTSIAPSYQVAEQGSQSTRAETVPAQPARTVAASETPAQICAAR